MNVTRIMARICIQNSYSNSMESVFGIDLRKEIMMERELRVHLDFYLKMNDGETKEQAEERFESIIKQMENIDNQESSYQSYETEVQEC